MSSLQSTTKRCTKCGEIKLLNEFHKTSRKYGNKTYMYHHAKCNKCRNEEKREWVKKNFIKIINYNKNYYEKRKQQISGMC